STKYTDFCVGLSLPVFMIMLLPVSAVTTWLGPETVDGGLRHADMLLHLDGFALTRFMLRIGGQRFLIAPIYSGLPLVMALAWISGRYYTLLRASVIAAALAVPFYLLVPAVGPQYAFANYPDAH